MRFIAIVVVLFVLAPAGAEAKKPVPPPPSGGGTSTTSTYVKNYANVLNGVQYDLTPNDVQATSDGGWLALATTQAPGSGVGVAWLLKASAVGAPQWQEEVGCLNTPPGAYADALSLQRTGDGGFVLAGGTVGCGSGDDCPSLSGFQCGLVEKLDGTGHVVWARVYDTGASATAIERIAPTVDGGFVAVGSASDVNHAAGALILKLDGLGNVQWQRELGPTGTSQATFYDVRQTADGGYVAAGEWSNGTTSFGGLPLESVLAAKFDAAGNVTWQHGFNNVSSTGAVTSTEHTQAIVQTSDGGYAIGGNWVTTFDAGACCRGALLLKLTPGGSLQWQVAYVGGVDCFPSGDSTMCTAIGGDVYSLRQTADGGYLLAGDANLEEADNAPIVPWLAKVDAAGGLVWHEEDYQAHTSTGRPLSEYFAASALTPAGPLGLGWTENQTNLHGELFGVQTDPSGAVGACAQIHPESILAGMNPGLAQLAPGLTASAPVASVNSSPAQTLATSAVATPSQC